MWYFSWILGLGLALTFGVLNAIWYEILETQREQQVLVQEAPPAASRR
jgi:cytochrome bd-I ubiquinol oxidase subunit X